jgi:hypothetical protein
MDDQRQALSLAAALRGLDEEMRRVAPSADWTLYYADSLLGQQHAPQ